MRLKNKVIHLTISYFYLIAHTSDAFKCVWQVSTVFATHTGTSCQISMSLPNISSVYLRHPRISCLASCFSIIHETMNQVQGSSKSKGLAFFGDDRPPTQQWCQGISMMTHHPTSVFWVFQNSLELNVFHKDGSVEDPKNYGHHSSRLTFSWYLAVELRQRSC